MRIALFTDTYTPDVNGVALTLKRWVDYLKKNGHQVIVFAPEGNHQTSTEEQNNRYKSFPFFLYPELQAAIANPIDIKNRLKGFKPDMIHVATPFNLGVIGRHYSLKHDIPFVASYHTHFDQYLKSYKLDWAKPVLDYYLTWFHQECLGIFAPSNETANYLIEKGYPNVSKWPRGVEYDLFKPASDKKLVKVQAANTFNLSPNKKTVLYVGRLATEKSIHILIDAVKQLPKHILYQTQVVIVGDGPIKDDILESIKHNDLPIYLLGFLSVSSLSLIYQASDLFFFPSSTETFGNVVLEALSSGLPVIGAHAGGVKELVTSSHNGILCPANHTDAFSEALLFLLNNPKVCQYYGQNARKFALEQSWDSIMANLVTEFETIQRQSSLLRA